MKSSRMRTPARQMLPPKTPKSRQASKENLIKDPVQVFCRIRPMQSDSDLSCIRVVSSSTVALIPPESAVNYKIISNKETQYVFKHIFDVDSTQHECFTTVAQPLVEGLIKGRNGLLFSYGVTGSGKTFTMTGNRQDRGIMPRCMDVLFKTISDYQAKKYVFKPDRLNGFDVLSEADAMLERQAEINARLMKLERKDTDIEIASRASTDVTTLSGLDEDNSFAVFISYIEIYNNSVYDLCEPTTQRNQPLQTKIIREDINHNMFVHGVTEIEVKSVEEALNAFHMGQKRKRMGHTILNSESSRSHSVFTIRLVQAPVDQMGEDIVQDRDKVTVSQLSLVDLAGSERTNRTKNTGQRLREAGNINNSLMTLRNCLEILRENNMTGAMKKVPYRDSKLTHLFKNFFDGEGQVKMIVCVNPRSEDYDETAQVMKFAEITQDVQIARQTPMKPTFDSGLTPGRRKANQLFRMAMHNLEENGRAEARDLEIDLGLVYKLPSFPDFHLRSENIQDVTRELMNCLEDRIRCRQRLNDDFGARQKEVRKLLYDMESENIRVKTENAALTATLNQERERIKIYESKIMRYETSLDALNRKLRDKDDYISQMEVNLGEKQHQLDKKEHEKEKQRRKFNSKIHEEAEKRNRELNIKLSEQKRMLNEQMRSQEEKLRLVTDIVTGEQTVTNEPVSNLIRRFNSNCENNQPPGSERKARPRGTVVSNLRHRRSKSVGNEKWLEHRPSHPVPLGTILQPYYNAKTVTSPEMKDLKKAKSSRYCLIDQQADTDGELETKLYKGEVIPTTSGGAQVVFDDVECLKQKAPTDSPPRKRKSAHGADDQKTPKKNKSIDVVESRCSIGIQGHKKARV
ncbi:CLUMA_CG017413, isoform A [Clunio marinus]|uniref:Kinesin-like protein n=1 Tax=Clunio marinus TaxID=568069 RepID=A0A1J1IYS6_9DIPT|nr:CLUMA_CG017413, isoform A [Clunio marinus]